MTDIRSVRPGGPVTIRVRPPGSKSITNRALLIAALAEGESRLLHPLLSDDTVAMRAGLTRLGAGFSEFEDGLQVTGGSFSPADLPLDVNLSGTSLRFLVAAAVLAPGQTVVDGRPRIRERPIAALANALVDLGVSVTTDPDSGGAPVTVVGGSMRGGVVEIDASVSSQPVSALMMIAPYAEAPLTMEFAGGQSISEEYLQTTAEVMAAFGIEPVLSVGRVTVPIGRYRPRSFVVEADASAAVYPWCAAAITGGAVSVLGISPSSTQPDLGVLEILEAMGCRIRRTTETIVVSGPAQLSAITADLGHCPDGAMAIAVCAAFADGPSHLTGLSSWSVKETDRLMAVATELRKLGATVERSDSSLTIEPPGALRSADISTYDDHRMAMAFSLAGLKVPGVRILDPGVVSKTWPEYWDEMERWT